MSDTAANEEPVVKTDSITDKLSFKSRFVLIFGEINDRLARATCERLIALAQESDAPIHALISSPGGHVESGDAIHDMIRFVNAPVTTIGSGWVASAGTHVFLAAPKERRHSQIYGVREERDAGRSTVCERDGNGAGQTGARGRRR